MTANISHGIGADIARYTKTNKDVGKKMMAQEWILLVDLSQM